MTEELSDIIIACVPIAVAMVGIVPTLITNRKKTTKTLEGIQEESTNSFKTINESVSGMNDDITELRKTLKEHIREDQWAAMKQARIRIIRFADELSQDKHRFSKAYFDEILEDINVYEDFCKKHDDFQNGRGKSCMEFIQKVNQELMETDGYAR